jgi:hypothetical protein
VLITSFTLWLMNWCGNYRFSGSIETQRPRRLWAVLFGLAIFVLGWAPIVAVRNQTVETRLFYYPLIGIIIVIAVFADSFISFCRISSPVRQYLVTLFGVGIAFVACTQAVCMVGIQSAFRERSRLDKSQVRQLRALVPDPKPGSVFVPLHTEDAAARTGFYQFDQFAISAFATFWSAPRALQFAYNRQDISSTFYLQWGPLPLVFENTGALYRNGLPPFDASPRDRTIIPYDRMIPFIVNQDGNVTLVQSLKVERASGENITLTFPPCTNGVSYSIFEPSTRMPESGSPDGNGSKAAPLRRPSRPATGDAPT